MSMQISVDPAALSQEQREAVAGFILAYPGKACAGTCDSHAHGVGGATTFPVITELELLQHDHESTMPESAFGKPDEAAAAFGVPPAPLPLGATAAPSIAVVVPSLTVPAAMPGITSTVAPTVPAPPAPTSVNVAPIAAPQTASPAGGVELDKNGLPWDGRIHAGTKRKNADGSWTFKRGVDPALVVAVESELRQVMGATGAPFVPPASTVTVAAGSTPTPTLAPAVVIPPPAAPSVTGEAPQDARQQFVGLVGRASAAIQAGKVTQAEVTQCCAAAGVPALPLLANRLDLVAQVAAQVDALIAAR